MTEFLQNILHGAASVLSVFPEPAERGKFYEHKASDTDALRSDWDRVGEDISKAFGKGIREQED